MIENRSTVVIWASFSIALHALILLGFNSFNPEIPISRETTSAKIRIFSNPSPKPASPKAPSIPTQTVATKTAPSPFKVPSIPEQVVIPESTPTPSSIETASQELPVSFGDDTKGGTVGDGFSTTNEDDFDSSITSNLLPLKRIEPSYPREAALNGTEGWAIFSIDITENGDVENITLMESNPSRIFERESRRALARWKYKPQIVNGKPVRIEKHTVRIVFKLEG